MCLSIFFAAQISAGPRAAARALGILPLILVVFCGCNVAGAPNLRTKAGSEGTQLFADLQLSTRVVTTFDIPRGREATAISLFLARRYDFSGRGYRIGCKITPVDGFKQPKRVNVSLKVMAPGGGLLYADSTQLRVRKNGKCKEKSGSFRAGLVPGMSFAVVSVEPVGGSLGTGTEVIVDFALSG